MRWPAGLCMLVVAPFFAAAARVGAAAPDGSATSRLVQQFLAIPDPAPYSYRALRHLEAENDHFNSRAWMDVWTDADDVHGFRYEIAGEGGSDFIRTKVFRETLETERRLWTGGTVSDRSAITPANYVLEPGPESGGCPSILIRPRRKDILLVEGFIVLDKDGGELVRMEGLLSKTPSFWTRRVHVTRYFQRIAGVRMPVEVESVANLLVAGRATLHMTYEYESVNDVHVGAPQPRH
jgi:hypothetical protein